MIAAPFGPFPLAPAPPVISAVGAVAPRLPTYPGIAYPTMFYWPYSSPPLSPSSPYYQSAHHTHIPAAASHHAMVRHISVVVTLRRWLVVFTNSFLTGSSLDRALVSSRSTLFVTFSVQSFTQFFIDL